MSDGSAAGKKKRTMKESEIFALLDKHLPCKFRLGIKGGPTMTEYVEMIQDVPGTPSDPTEADLLAACEGRRKR